MSSAVNHRRRSHRSERRKASAFGGFKPAVSPSREKPKGGIRNEADQL